MKLSIITINRNNVKGLRKTIESVVFQTFNDFEYIIIDGASADGSVDVIKEYQDRISFWMSEPDNGIYNAMNKGIVKACGEYCLFLNSGDYLVDKNILSYIESLLDSDIVAGYVEELLTGRKIMPPQTLSVRTLYEQNISHQAEFIKRKLFDSSLYSEDLWILSDYEFNLKMSMRDVSFKYLNCCVAYVENGGISSMQIEDLNRERSVIFERLLPKSVLSDYEYWLNKKTYSNNSVKWIVASKIPFKILKLAFKIFHENNK